MVHFNERPLTRGRAETVDVAGFLRMAEIVADRT
jgi:hypothetical protein